MEKRELLLNHSYLVEVSLTGGAGGLSSSSDMLKAGKGWPNVLNLAVYAVIQNKKFPVSSSRTLPPPPSIPNLSKLPLVLLIFRLPVDKSLFVRHPRCQHHLMPRPTLLWHSRSVYGVKWHEMALASFLSLLLHQGISEMKVI